MSSNPRVTPHEANTGGRFTSDNAGEMGARGAAKREELWHDRVFATRQELAVHTDLAVARIRAILENGKDPDALRAAIALLDRIGAGPHSVQEMSVGLSLVEQWAQELDAIEAEEGS